MGGSCWDQCPVRQAGANEIDRCMRRIGKRLVRAQGAVLGTATVAHAEWVGGDHHEAARGHVLGEAVAVTPGRWMSQ